MSRVLSTNFCYTDKKKRWLVNNKTKAQLISKA